ncbi:UNVERIFIED_CONTAM: hypothetical protein RMT77_014623 [Armadillidium vulgare]
MKNFVKIYGMGFLLVLLLSVDSSSPAAQPQHEIVFPTTSNGYEQCAKNCNERYQVDAHRNHCLKTCKDKYPSS